MGLIPIILVCNEVNKKKYHREHGDFKQRHRENIFYLKQKLGYEEEKCLYTHIEKTKKAPIFHGSTDGAYNCEKYKAFVFSLMLFETKQKVRATRVSVRT